MRAHPPSRLSHAVHPPSLHKPWQRSWACSSQMDRQTHACLVYTAAVIFIDPIKGGQEHASGTGVHSRAWAQGTPMLWCKQVRPLMQLIELREVNRHLTSTYNCNRSVGASGALGRHDQAPGGV